MDKPSVTVSASRKINLGNYESQDVFVSISGVTPEMTRADMLELLECGNEAYDLICEEIDRRVELVKNPPKKNQDAHSATAIRITRDWEMAQKLEFTTLCKNLGKDHVNTVICAHEEGCTSYDEFVAYAAGTKPKNAKPRLEVAK